MSNTATQILGQWTSFYSVVATAAAQLTGLTFIIITLLDRDDRPNSPEGVSTFTTPTIVHFGAALCIATSLLAPWRTLLVPAVVLGAAGAYGVYHMCCVIRQARSISSYTPDTEDWTWYAIAPLMTYCALVAGACALPTQAPLALFIVAASSVALLAIGIRNAWDIVTYITVANRDEASADGDENSRG